MKLSTCLRLKALIRVCDTNLSKWKEYNYISLNLRLGTAETKIRSLEIDGTALIVTCLVGQNVVMATRQLSENKADLQTLSKNTCQHAVKKNSRKKPWKRVAPPLMKNGRLLFILKELAQPNKKSYHRNAPMVAFFFENGKSF